MKIIKKEPVDSELIKINEELIFLNSNIGFYKKMIDWKLPNVLGLSKLSVNTFKKKFGLEIVNKISSNLPFNQYINVLNQFTSKNIVTDFEIKVEVYSSALAISDEKFISEISKQLKELNLETVFIDKEFISLLLEKTKYSKTEKKFIPLFKTKIKEFQESKIYSSIEDINEEGTYDNFYNFFKKLSKSIDISKRTEGRLEEGLDTSIDYSDLSKEEKMDIIKKYGINSNIYTIDIVNLASKLFENKDLNLVFNPEIEILNKLNEKYKSFAQSIVLNEQNCSLYKSIIYASVFMLRDKIKNDPTEYMNNIINRDTRWAVGTENTLDSSFYGKSNLWKAFYGYGPFMTGRENPFKEIINNTEVNEMDRNAILMHRWFKENGISDLIYEMIFDKSILGDYSIYDLLSQLKDLINLIEEPIVVSSSIDSLSTLIKGIVAGMINSFTTTMDFAISGIARQLFFKKFIPFGKGKKVSIAEFHDYIAFISAILKCYEDGAPISAIDKDSFANALYQKISGSVNNFEYYGYGAFDDNLNLKNNLSIYEEKLSKNINGRTYYFSKDSKVVHALVMFSIQKQMLGYGNGFSDIINYGKRSFIKNSIKKLTESEVYFVMKNFKINFYKFDDNFNKYSEEELLKFNEKTIDAQLYLDLSLETFGFYKQYVEYDKNILEAQMRQDAFYDVRYEKFISKSINIYFKHMYDNKINLSKAIYDENNVSDVDDFLLRFLPSFEELIKLLGLNGKLIKSLIYVLDYICEFITSVLFQKLYMEIKNLLHDYVKQISDECFQFIDNIGEKLGGGGNFVLSFELGGRLISGKINSLLKVLRDFTLTTKFLDQCFFDEGMRNVNIDSFIEEEINTGKDKFPDIDDEGEGGGGGSIWDPDDEYDENRKPYPDRENDVVINIIDKRPGVKPPKDNNKPKKPFDPSDPPKKIVYEEDKIKIVTENDKEIIIVNKNDTIKNKNTSITEETKKVIESNIVSKEEIEQFIEIRDFINTITNKIILDLQNKINSNKNNIEKELNKKKPDKNKLDEYIEKEKELLDELDKILETNKIKFNKIDKEKTKIESEEEIILHNFANGEINIDKIKNILGDLNDFSTNNKIPLTNAQIMELLK